VGTQDIVKTEEVAFAGNMPSREGQRTLEMHGMAPIPPGNRYGRLVRVFTVWFTPNLVPAAFFIGTLATASFIGLGFWLGSIACLVGTAIGSLLAAVLGTFGPTTGLGQLPFARLQFGKTIIVPGILQWASTVVWDALNAIFGADAVHLLIHVPFWVGLAIILLLQGLLGLFGYEVLHTFQKWMAVVLGIMFIIISVKIAQVGDFHAGATAHGGPAIGGFLLLAAIAASFVVSWGAYASDYTRYMKPDASKRAIFWLTLAGLTISSVWIEVLGAAVSAIAVKSTAGGLRDVLGGGTVGALGLVAIWIGTIAVNAMDDYSGSLALQATGLKVKRPVIAIAVTVLAFALTLWLNTGDLASKFTNLILFITYWIPPFGAVQIVDWYRHRGHPDVSGVLDNSRLISGWEALVALCVGFGVSVPFMDTTLFVGPISKHVLWGGDIALAVGFVVGGGVYAWLRRWSTRSARDTPDTPERVTAPEVAA
jgi:NCS1 family nucleobase:cation symporter-1